MSQQYNRIQAILIMDGLRMYKNSGLIPTRGWGPKRMMEAAKTITGRNFGARDYLGAALAIEVLLNEDDNEQKTEQGRTRRP